MKVTEWMVFGLVVMGMFFVYFMEIQAIGSTNFQ